MSLKRPQYSLLIFLLMSTPNIFYCDELSTIPQNEHYAVPPPQYPSDQSGMTLFLDASYTFWAPYQNGMFLLTTNSITEQTASWIKTSFPAQSGFKAGIGFNTYHDDWKIQAEYTWFYNHPSAQPATLQLSDFTYYSPWVNLPDNSPGGITSKFCNTFQRVDLTLDRTYYLGDYLAVGPWIGLLGAWDDQLFYVNISPIEDGTPPSRQDYRIMTQTMDWWCIGPYIGVDSSFYFSDEWAVFLTGGASLNLALHCTNAQVTDNTINNPVIINNTGVKIPAIETMFETSIGLRLDSSGQNWGLRVQMGWELQAWLDHSTFIQTVGDTFDLLPSYGTYGMQGLTVKIRLNF